MAAQGEQFLPLAVSKTRTVPSWLADASRFAVGTEDHIVDRFRVALEGP